MIIILEHDYKFVGPGTAYEQFEDMKTDLVSNGKRKGECPYILPASTVIGTCVPLEC